MKLPFLRASIVIGAAIVAVLGALLACGNTGFDPASKVDSVRLFAVRADKPAYSKPRGEDTRYEGKPKFEKKFDKPRADDPEPRQQPTEDAGSKGEQGRDGDGERCGQKPTEAEHDVRDLRQVPEEINTRKRLSGGR